jgi:DNA-binding CsgD family transcriptional regulator
MTATMELGIREAGDTQTTASQPGLRPRFVDARRRTRGPLVGINDDELLKNASASRLVETRDREQLWDSAQRAIMAGDRSMVLRLRDREFSAQCEVLYEQDHIIGALIRFDEVATDRTRDRHSLGWASLTQAEVGVALLVSRGLTNRETGARLFMSHHTVDSHLRQIFRKLQISSRIELTRLVVEHGYAEVDPS